MLYVRRAAAGAPQAVEAKENVRIQDETVTLASISYQNFFRSYPVRPRRAPAGAPARPRRRGEAHYRRVFSPSLYTVSARWARGQGWLDLTAAQAAGPQT